MAKEKKVNFDFFPFHQAILIWSAMHKSDGCDKSNLLSQTHVANKFLSSKEPKCRRNHSFFQNVFQKCLMLKLKLHGRS
jgi:hypothetical protein